MLRFTRVEGQSMSPTLEDGDFVVALGGPLLRSARRGDVVLVAHPELGTIVKRIAEIDVREERVELAGDSPLSCSRESLGSIPRRAILGRAVLRVSPGPRGTTRIRRGLGRLGPLDTRAGGPPNEDGTLPTRPHGAAPEPQGLTRS